MQLTETTIAHLLLSLLKFNSNTSIITQERNFFHAVNYLNKLHWTQSSMSTKVVLMRIWKNVHHNALVKATGCNKCLVRIRAVAFIVVLVMISKGQEMCVYGNACWHRLYRSFFSSINLNIGSLRGKRLSLFFKTNILNAL